MGLFVEDAVSQRIQAALRRGLDRPDGAFGHQLHIGFAGYDPARGEYLLTARTEGWMRNIDGVVHGGFCAAIYFQNSYHFLGTNVFSIGVGSP